MEEMKFKISFGASIKRIRKDKGITQEVMAEKVGIEIHNLSRIETGKTFPRARTIAKILEVLDAEPSDIFNFSKSNVDLNLKIKINEIIDQYPQKAEDFYKILLVMKDSK